MNSRTEDGARSPPPRARSKSRIRQVPHPRHAGRDSVASSPSDLATSTLRASIRPGFHVGTHDDRSRRESGPIQVSASTTEPSPRFPSRRASEAEGRRPRSARPPDGGARSQRATPPAIRRPVVGRDLEPDSGDRANSAAKATPRGYLLRACRIPLETLVDERASRPGRQDRDRRRRPMLLARPAGTRSRRSPR